MEFWFTRLSLSARRNEPYRSLVMCSIAFWGTLWFPSALLSCSSATASHTLCRRSFFVQFRQVVNGGEKVSHLGPLVSTSVLSNCSGEMPVLTTVVTDVAGEADRLCCESYASQVLLNLGTRGYPGCASACSFCRSFPGSGRLRRRIVRTLDAFSPRSYNVATLPEILPPVTMS